MSATTHRTAPVRIDEDGSLPSIWEVVKTTAWVVTVAAGATFIAGLIVGAFAAGVHVALSALL